LAIRAVRDRFRPIGFPTLAKTWYNAFDPRDVVSLYPLDATNFPVTPSIENFGGVNNATDNRHGIVGYLDDADVARQRSGRAGTLGYAPRRFALLGGLFVYLGIRVAMLEVR